jgi:catechol 2,3-dioxygenase-like lactoylglutathione lyase family enzyme
MSAFKVEKLFVVTLWAPDIPESLHFYREVLGLEWLPHHEGQPAFVVGDGIHLTLRKGKPVPAENALPFPVIAFQVADLDQALQHLKANGVKMAGDIVTKSGVRYCTFYDPAGNLIEIAEVSSEPH